MITAKQVKSVVERNRNYLKINSRIEMENMVYLTMDLLKEAGYKDAAYFTKALYDELENMNTDELIKEQIWVGRNKSFKGICLNCGKEVEGELIVDELGPHIVCPNCGASSDVTDEEYDD